MPLRPNITGGAPIAAPDPGAQRRQRPVLTDPVVKQPTAQQLTLVEQAAANPSPFSTTPPGVGDDVVMPTFVEVPELEGDSGLTPGDAPLPADATFEELNASSLDSALAAIEAQFGLTREELLASQSAIGQEYQLLFAQAQQARERGLEQVEQAGQERGITRSGIQAEAVADTASEFDQQLAFLEAQQSTQEESILSQLAGLELQERLARQQAERDAQLRALDQEVLQALAAAGL